MVKPWIRRVFLIHLCMQVLIVLSGGIVRLTGSGLGCTTAPQCVPGSIIPVADQHQGLATVIEFSNRILSVLVGFVALLAVIAAWKSGSRRLLQLSGIPIIFTLVQGILGGITVNTGLHPGTVMAHFLFSAILVAAASVLYIRSIQPDQPRQLTVRKEVWWLGIGMSVALAAVLIAGTVTTGTGPHAGDAENPPRFNLDLQFVTHIHAEIGIAFAMLVVAMLIALRLSKASQLARELSWWLLAAVALQATIGYLQVFSGLPILLVAMHMLAASLLVVVMAFLMCELRRAPDTALAPAETGASDQAPVAAQAPDGTTSADNENDGAVLTAGNKTDGAAQPAGSEDAATSGRTSANT